MAEQTGISWTDHTFNIAWGCTKISPGCKHCYAETLSARWGNDVFGTRERRTFGEKHWAEPLRWNARAEREGVRRRVFCSSMCDVFEDHPIIDQERAKLWPLTQETPWLDWQLLTKRADRIEQGLPSDWGEGYRNVWLGVSAENQEWADRRIPWLMDVPASLRFISYEPALGPLDIRKMTGCDHPVSNGCLCWPKGIDWVIAGGESGPGFRPADVGWFRSMRDQCRAAGVPFFFKQSSGLRPGCGIKLDGEVIQEMPI